MEALTPYSYADMPVTDMQHVINEINRHRRYLDYDARERRRRSEYMKAYRDRKNGERNNQA